MILRFQCLCALSILLATSLYSQPLHYGISQTFHIGSAGGWDYLAINNNKLYVSHGTQVNILDKKSGDSLGVILNTTGVHGIAFIPSKGKGYISNGRLNNVYVFDLATDTVINQVATGKNPDAIVYDNYSKMVITCNGSSNNLSFIDPADDKVKHTIAVGGKPETAVSDEAGKLFVNIEDKNEIVEIDLKKFTVVKHWSLAPAEEPTGLAMDRKHHLLFAGCDRRLVIVNALTGKVVRRVAIGEGCDGVAFNPKTNEIFTSNGEGTISVIKEVAGNQFKSEETIISKRGARTITLDETSGSLYLPTADFESSSAADERPVMVPGTFQVLVIKKHSK